MNSLLSHKNQPFQSPTRPKAEANYGCFPTDFPASPIERGIFLMDPEAIFLPHVNSMQSCESANPKIEDNRCEV